MEESLFITRHDGLISWGEKYSRLYYGNEFCSYLIPSIMELEEILDFVEEKKTGFSLVTGYAANEDLKKYEALFKILRKRLVDSELIINDWGIFELSGDFPMRRVLGRLLSKQKKGMRILNIFDKLPQKAINRFQEVSLNANFINFLIKNNVKRVEIDNLLQGYRLVDIKADLSFSLYMPYAYVTTTRLCPLNVHNQNRKEPLKIPFTCDKTCREKGCYKLSTPHMPVCLILNGNTIFYKSEKINLLCPDKHLDRIVFQPNLPL